MKEEIKENLEAFLKKSLEFVERTVEFAGEQVPLVIKEIIRYTLVIELILLLRGTVIFTVGLYLVYKGYASEFSEPSLTQEEVKCTLFYTGGFILAIWGASLVELGKLVKVIVAPRLFLIDQLREMTKK